MAQPMFLNHPPKKLILVLLLLLLSRFSRVWLCATPWTAAHQAPPSIGFSRQEYWSGVPLPSPDFGASTFIRKWGHIASYFQLALGTENSISLQVLDVLIHKKSLKIQQIFLFHFMTDIWLLKDFFFQPFFFFFFFTNTLRDLTQALMRKSTPVICSCKQWSDKAGQDSSLHNWLFME